MPAPRIAPALHAAVPPCRPSHNPPMSELNDRLEARLAHEWQHVDRLRGR